MKANPLLFCLSEETADIVDQLLDDFLLKQVGKNDMAVVSGMLCAAALMIITHCQRTGDDPQKLFKQVQQQFELACKVASGFRGVRKQGGPNG